MSGKRKRNYKGVKKRKTERKKGQIHFWIFLQALASLIFFGVVILLDMFPMKYLLMIAVVLLLLWSITMNLQIAHRKTRGLGKILSLLLIVVLSAGSYYVIRTNDMIHMIANGGHKSQMIAVAVLKDDEAQTLQDASGYLFGLRVEENGGMEETLLAVEKEMGADIETTVYDSVEEQAEALCEGEVGAIVYNEAYLSQLEKVLNEYGESIRVIYREKIRVEMDFGGTDRNITKEPFTVYLSGIDVYVDSDTGEAVNSSGETGQGRSDVNILAVVNPTTQQILLITTPRDYYVNIPGVSGGTPDKLTHAGLYGIDASMATLSELYETDIKYYARMNFNALIDIVDILGGIDVYSNYEFTTSHEASGDDIFTVKEGYNHLNGSRALAFSRERQNLAEGDIQRGRNQQAVITAMIKKMLSPTILVKANNVIEAIGDNAETNLTKQQINGLIKYQLGTNAKWSIKSVSATAEPMDAYCYSLGNTLVNVINPDYDVINEIIQEVNVVEEGGLLEGAESL